MWKKLVIPVVFVVFILGIIFFFYLEKNDTYVIENENKSLVIFQSVSFDLIFIFSLHVHEHVD